MTQLLARTRIVLVRPSLPDNVGAVARAMRHFGLERLVVVGGVDPLHPLAVRVAAGAEAILAAAVRHETLEEALSDVLFAVGTTARPYQTPDLRTEDPRELALLARAHAGVGAIALVFGTEKSGLSKQDLRRCHQLARIPGTEHACLNLAMAVTIMAYEWFRAEGAELPPDELPMLAAAAGESTWDELGSLLAVGLEQAGILRPSSAGSKTHTLRRILSRTRLDPDEAALVRAIVRKLPTVLRAPSRD